MRCHLCFEHSHIATTVVLLASEAERPYVMRLCDDHTTDYEHRDDATVVAVPPMGRHLIAA